MALSNYLQTSSIFRRYFYPTSKSINRYASSNPKQPTELKGRSVAAQKWLLRQFKDPYVIKSKLANYRSRSAFKLIEIDDRYRFLHPGSKVVDCGAAPGGWTQVVVDRINALGEKKKEKRGIIVAVDKSLIMPINGAFVMEQRDFMEAETRKSIIAHFSSDQSSIVENCLDVVLSDMAPKASGNPECDHERIIELCYQAFLFAIQHLNKGGYFLTKLWDGSIRQKLNNDLEKHFDTVSSVKPNASRDDSTELFLLARSFKGLKRS